VFHSHDLESVQVVFGDSSEQFLSCVPSVTELVMTTKTTTMMMMMIMIIIIIIIIDTKPLFSRFFAVVNYVLSIRSILCTGKHRSN
jgi:hypothetical protein